MVTEQNKSLKALQFAIQMEIDGKKFYLEESEESSNELGKKLLKTLANEEDVHLQKFEQIYEAIRNKKAWPKIDYQPDGGKGLRTLFAQATKQIGTDIKPATTELAAVQTAMDMENKSYDFYKSQSKSATYNSEREFYENSAAQERVHYLVLLDYYEYVKNPASWFVNKEHPSLDGG